MSELISLLRSYDAEIRRLKREINHLENPETIRSKAGELIRNEIQRQTRTLAELQNHVRETRRSMARRLRETLERARSGTAVSLSELENAVRDTIALLEDRY